MKPYYEKSGITIYHADCREVLPTLEPGSVDLVLTDPPYAVSVAGASFSYQGTRNLDFFACDGDWGEMTATAVAAVELAVDRLSDSGSVYAWCGHRQFGRLVEALEGRGFSTRFLVWVKKCPPPVPPRSGWGSGAELCVYGYRAGRTWTAVGVTAPTSNVLVSDSYRHGMPGKVGHPTQKPTAVVSPLIAYSSNPGDTILDPFMGSGTTLVAARDMGRKAIGIEISEEYCRVAVNRLKQGVLFA